MPHLRREKLYGWFPTATDVYLNPVLKNNYSREAVQKIVDARAKELAKRCTFKATPAESSRPFSGGAKYERRPNDATTAVAKQRPIRSAPAVQLRTGDRINGKDMLTTAAASSGLALNGNNLASDQKPQHGHAQTQPRTESPTQQTISLDLQNPQESIAKFETALRPKTASSAVERKSPEQSIGQIQRAKSAGVKSERNPVRFTTDDGDDPSLVKIFGEGNARNVSHSYSADAQKYGWKYEINGDPYRLKTVATRPSYSRRVETRGTVPIHSTFKGCTSETFFYNTIPKRPMTFIIDRSWISESYNKQQKENIEQMKKKGHYRFANLSFVY